MVLLAQEIGNKTKHLDMLELSFCLQLLRNMCLGRSKTLLGFCLQNYNVQDFRPLCQFWRVPCKIVH